MMGRQHGMLSPMATPRERDRVTADDIAHDEQLEIVRGEIVRKASPTMMHGMVHYVIGAAVAGYHGAPGPGRPGGWVFGNEVTIAFDPHEEVYRPDTAGWRIERAPDPSATGPVTVAPDWVLEVLSPSTMNHDLGQKLHTYHRAHVGHYWLAHPHPTKQLLQVYRWHEQGYLLVLTAGAGNIVRAEPFDAVELDITRVLAWPAGTAPLP
jgi:Uma2 family endonuclease